MKAKSVWIVVQHGVYRHVIHGPCWTFASAKKLAWDVIKLEPDDHHSMLIIQLTDGLSEHVVAELCRHTPNKYSINYGDELRTDDSFVKEEGGYIYNFHITPKVKK